MISLIAAVAEDGAIGGNNALLWHIPEDFKWFKEKTKNKPVIMGRNTHESIGRALPNRENIVITRQENYTPKEASVRVENSLTTALESCDNALENFVIGGEKIYEEALPLADRMYITLVQKDYPKADTFFPDFDFSEWEKVFEEDHDAPEDDAHPAFTFLILERKK